MAGGAQVQSASTDCGKHAIKHVATGCHLGASMGRLITVSKERYLLKWFIAVLNSIGGGRRMGEREGAGWADQASSTSTCCTWSPSNLPTQINACLHQLYSYIAGTDPIWPIVQAGQWCHDTATPHPESDTMISNHVVMSLLGSHKGRRAHCCRFMHLYLFLWWLPASKGIGLTGSIGCRVAHAGATVLAWGSLGR